MKRLFVTVFLLLLWSIPIIYAEDLYDHIFIKERFIVSNYPESISEPGLIFNEQVKNEAFRVMYYHKCVSKFPIEMNLLVTNKGKSPTPILVYQGIAGPHIDGFWAGDKSTEKFYRSLLTKQKPIIIQPGHTESLLVHPLTFNKISTGIVRIQPTIKSSLLGIQLKVIDPRYPGIGNIDSHYTYASFNQGFITLKSTIDLKNIQYEIPIGHPDQHLKDQNNIELQGNYGLLYDIQLNITNSNSWYQPVDLLVSPLGGGLRTTVMVNQSIAQTRFLSHHTNLNPEQIKNFLFNPLETKTLRIVMMPEAGSFYPVNLVVQRRKL